ncbi:UNVERIFIED_CONTAM: hypothetical protein K2H54_057990 [Gekko kuhli]
MLCSVSFIFRLSDMAGRKADGWASDISAAKEQAGQLGSISHPGHQKKTRETETTVSRHTGDCNHCEQRHCPHYGRRQHLSPWAPEEDTGY